MKMNDDAHQLTSVAASRPSDAARYRYDAAGNPVDRAELGLDVTNSFNNLNQIVTGSWTGATLTVAGSVNYPTGSISVNGQPGTVYPDSSFDVPGVPVVPGTNTLVATYTGPAFTNVPMTATDTSTVVLGDTAYTHDANGNLTGDATFTYQYDLANQLTNVIRKSDSASVLSCRYDALGRRVEAIRADGTVDRYVYFPGSFLVLAVLDGNNAPKELYTRGPDLSGTLDSAGGIGGILACTYASGPALYHHADLMGNVIALTDFSSILVSTFHYTPFGQLRCSLTSIVSRFLFSSKEWEDEIALLNYGQRYYNPQQGMWINRDVIAERGGLNLYSFLSNNPVNAFDPIGRLCIQVSDIELTTEEWVEKKKEPIFQKASLGFMLEDIWVTWQLEGEVECCCDGERKTVTITKEVRNSVPPEYYSTGTDSLLIVATRGGAMPLSIPTATDVPKAIGELGASVLDSEMDKVAPYFMTPEDARRFQNFGEATRPGSLEDGKRPDNPCE